MSEVKNFGFEIRPSRASSVFEFPTGWTVVYANLRVSVSYSGQELELQNTFLDLEQSCCSRNTVLMTRKEKNNLELYIRRKISSTEECVSPKPSGA